MTALVPDGNRILDAILARLPVENREGFVRLIHAYNIRPDSADLIQAAIASEVLSATLRAIETERGRIEGTARDLPEAMRAAAVPIVSGLVEETRDAVIDGVRTDLREDLITVFQGVANIVDEQVAEQRTAAFQVASSAKEAIATLSAAAAEATQTTHAAAVKLLQASSRVGGWTPSRIGTTGLGAVAVMLAFAFGWTAQTAATVANQITGCNTRVATLARHTHLPSRWVVSARRKLCQGDS